MPREAALFAAQSRDKAHFWRLRVPACNADIRELRARRAVRHPGSEGGGLPAQLVGGLRGFGAQGARGSGAAWPLAARGRTPAAGPRGA